MPITSIKSTETLTPYAQAHKKELVFGLYDVVPPQELKIETRKLNWFSKCVKKIDQANSSLAVFGRAMLIFGLMLSLVGIPVLVLWKREGRLSDEDKKAQYIALENLNIGIKQLNKKAEIIENMGIQNFERLPILDLKGRMGDTDYLDFLTPKELPEALMKGIDKYQRPFLAIKLKDKRNDHVFVTTLFQRATNGEKWTWISEGGLINPLSHLVKGDFIGADEEKIFNDIIHNKHPEFTLAN